MEIPKEELLAPGHRGCAGCGATLGVRLALKVLGKNTIAVSATGCLEVITTPYPETAWEIPWIHVAFENAAAVASGIERALKAKGKKDINVVAFAGDGGTADIGMQALSGAMERGHNIIYICYDNEAYMNTGIQRSGATPYGASTTTSPPGKKSFGEDRPKKNMPFIMAAHGVPYVATASISYPEDFMKKVKKAKETEGPAYIHLHQPCTTGWGFDPSKTIEIGRLAVETGAWLLYEIEEGEFKITYRPIQRKPVTEYLEVQRRFKHLKEKEKAKIQEYIDKICAELRI
ncbi:MAG TPA: pyruvate synthase subunit beta [Methanothermobacter sp.]|jgi:pyruvate ferredoxin oxidoreductase beta subunit|uniref:Pyruvate ferredoxin oxidoreductase subunit beta n=1 Tax=Methanothermobacter tenebrarum TaxID=680118 RepID=A0ABM7YFI5_9EURY|nr:pyruvate synthase subunit PorB [Methanothermobacter tenebrarum]MDD3453913.1 pyruvate synthase subunit PorB [Methanobacteriales archaeon]MDI6882154.1 pyruvate synthase subunit PorB [Methanothermobacter sp.]MDX9692778.1 pyruvate synthase subunit PorB [Methanothermobacter sp.]BDH80079.1 pyruvate ferredoxin oxidoreductase subunit beta [Methanothermobacter tenebrarum]HHW15962.1 pyruvate synthase subunit beta [Methanothermobacter sp.]